MLTCCLSMLLPLVCACDMKDQLQDTVKSLNDTIFKPRGLILKFRCKFLRTSWFEVWKEENDKLFETVVSELSMDATI
jgi:hypothetical protein